MTLEDFWEIYRGSITALTTPYEIVEAAWEESKKAERERCEKIIENAIVDENDNAYIPLIMDAIRSTAGEVDSDKG